MELSDEIIQLGIIAFIALSVGGLAFGLLYPYFTGSASAAKRVSAVSNKSETKSKGGLRAMLQADSKDNRRRQIQDSLKELEEREKQRKKKRTLRTQLLQAGLDISVRNFWIASVIVGGILAFGTLIGGAPTFVAPIAGFVGALGLPRWFIPAVVSINAR